MSAQIKKLIKQGENEKVELRGARTHTKTLARSICGMLNQQGGLVVLGVDDDGDVVGVADPDHDVADLHSHLADHLSPLPLVSIVRYDIDGKTVVVIEVPEGADKPYSLGREIFVRVGKQTMKASADQSSAIVQETVSQFDRWEYEALPGFDFADCDSDEISDALHDISKSGRLGSRVPQNKTDFLRRLHLARGGQFTNGCAVLFGEEPLNWSPNLAIRVVSFSGKKTGDISNDTLIHGPAVQCLRKAVDTLQQRTGYSGRFTDSDIERADVPAYPLFALREGLVNAIVHRDYSILGGQIRVEIYQDRLTIQNPGRLPEGWKLDDLKKRHGSVPFNPDIARVFYLRMLMEQLGIGTQKVIEECKKLKASPPIWDNDQNMVTLTLFPAPEPSLSFDLNSRQQMLLKKYGPGKSFKTSDYAELTGVVDRQARRELNELIDYGLVERSGRGPATIYIRTKRAAS